MAGEISATSSAGEVLAAYRAANEERLRHDPEFAAWLDREYVPIAGGWMY
jgi:hypothetical protein